MPCSKHLTSQPQRANQRAARQRARAAALRTLPVALLTLLSAGRAPTQPARTLFVTSSSGSANLSTWPAASGADGLAAGDAICRSHARAAGLAGAQQYIAWLSDSSDDAWCRAHGLSGTRADNCGQGSLPDHAGPWLRSDGFPFGGPLPRLLDDHAALAPVRFDESGIETSSSFWTGTRSDGTVSNSCEDWTSADAPFGTIGRATDTADGWSSAAATSCSSSRSLLCLQPGTGASLPAFEREGALAFITADTGPADLSQWMGAGGASGVAAGDAVCRARAESRGLERPETFRAWLSDSSSNAADRLTTNGPWVRFDGVPIAESMADLTDGTLFAPLNRRPDSFYVGSRLVWTGTTTQGSATDDHCSDWSSVSSSIRATIGLASRSNGAWTDNGSTSACDRQAHLYCLQDLQTTVGGCVPDGDTLCLGSAGRFALETTWQSPTESGTADAVDIDRRDSGLFTFFDPNNLELLVKVLDGCALNDHYWVFYGATTDVAFTLSVIDTLTGTVRDYSNPLGTSAEPIKDLLAFPCSN